MLKKIRGNYIFTYFIKTKNVCNLKKYRSKIWETIRDEIKAKLIKVLIFNKIRNYYGNRKKLSRGIQRK